MPGVLPPLQFKVFQDSLLAEKCAIAVLFSKINRGTKSRLSWTAAICFRANMKCWWSSHLEMGLYRCSSNHRSKDDPEGSGMLLKVSHRIFTLLPFKVFSNALYSQSHVFPCWSNWPHKNPAIMKGTGQFCLKGQSTTTLIYTIYSLDITKKQALFVILTFL